MPLVLKSWLPLEAMSELSIVPFSLQSSWYSYAPISTMGGVPLPGSGWTSTGQPDYASPATAGPAVPKEDPMPRTPRCPVNLRTRRAALLSVAVMAPSLGAGLMMDDYMHRALFLGRPLHSAGGPAITHMFAFL